MVNNMDKIETGIEGMDELLYGGIPKNRVICLAGEPGAGKSIFAMQYLYNGVVKYNEPGIYISFEERISDIIENMKGLNMDIEPLIKQNRLIIHGIRPKIVLVGDNPKKSFSSAKTKEFGTDVVIEALKRDTDNINAKRIVIDSAAGLALQTPDMFEIRQTILKLVGSIQDLGSTAIVTTEKAIGSGGVTRFGIEEFVTQGVIILEQKEAERTIQILKMRGTNIKTGKYPYEITEKGIVIHSEAMLG